MIHELTFGGIRFNLCYSGFPYKIAFDKNQLPFLPVSQSLNDKNIKDFVKTDVLYSVPPAGQENCVHFTLDDSWKISRTGNDYRIEFQSPGRKAYWICDLDPRLSDFRMFYHPVRNSRADEINPFSYPADQLITICLLSWRDGLLLHSAGGLFRHRGIVFAGPSGAGKSTISRLMQSHPEWLPINDDRIILRKTESGFSIHGTPWPGESGICFDHYGMLQSVIFIRQNEPLDLRKLDPKESLIRLIPTVSVPWFDVKMTDRVLTLCENILLKVPMYELSYRPADPVFKLLEVVFSQV